MPKVSTSTVKSAGVTVDLEDFRKLARQLRKADVELNSEVRKMLRAMGMLVAEEAKAQAEWSTKIPPGISVRLSGMTVAVVSKTTLGALEEVGGKSHPGVTWRHPLWGGHTSPRFVVQHTHPYLLPALRDKSEEVESATSRIVGLVLDRALEE